MKHLGIKLSLFLIYFVFAALLNSVGILVERSQEVYDVTKEAAALLEPFKDISIALVSFLVGSFLPKLGYKKGMLISLAIIFLGCIGMYFANSFWAVKILFACTGIRKSASSAPSVIDQFNVHIWYKDYQNAAGRAKVSHCATRRRSTRV